MGKEKLTEIGKKNIVGIEGLLWSENLHTPEEMYYLLLPKLLGVSERAWSKDPEWTSINDSISFQNNYNRDWSSFVNLIGKRQLKMLDHYNGGYIYRIPPPGALIKNDTVFVNNQFPGLTLKYSENGSEPSVKSKTLNRFILKKGTFKICAVNSAGRKSKTITIKNN